MEMPYGVMNAKVLPDDFHPEPGKWVAEEKYDGHRILMCVTDHAEVHVWSRYGKTRPLPAHVLHDAKQLVPGVYDGELLVQGGRSYNVKEGTKAGQLVYVIFDLLRVVGVPTICEQTYDVRRESLEYIFVQRGGQMNANGVMLAPSHKLLSREHMLQLRDEVWQRDGEGLIIKRRAGLYLPGKRTKEFMKLKKLETAVVTVIGWAESRGEKNYRGPYGMTRFRDDAGFESQVKTLNDHELARFEERGRNCGLFNENHPDLGRKLRIEFVEKTPDGAYWHPRWDRWEDE